MSDDTKPLGSPSLNREGDGSHLGLAPQNPDGTIPGEETIDVDMAAKRTVPGDVGFAPGTEPPAHNLVIYLTVPYRFTAGPLEAGDRQVLDSLLYQALRKALPMAGV